MLKNPKKYDVYATASRMNWPDDFIHGRISKERLVQLVVAPLTVADQVQYDVLPEKPLILHSQPGGPQDLLCIIPIYMDRSAVHHLTCDTNVSITKGQGIHWKVSKFNLSGCFRFALIIWQIYTLQHKIPNFDFTDDIFALFLTDRHRYSTKRISLSPTEWCNPLGCSQWGGCSRRLCSEEGLKGSKFLERSLGQWKSRHRGPVQERTQIVFKFG